MKRCPKGRVRIISKIPVDKKHGITVDRIFPVLRWPETKPSRHDVRVWVMGDAGEEIGLLVHEYELLDEVEVRTPRKGAR